MPKAKISLDLNHLPKLPRNKKPGIGCIGSGFIMADCHLVAYRKAGFNPVAIASQTYANAQRVAERHNIAKAYPTYQEMLEDKKVEVVDVAVPPDLQLGVLKEVVKHKHIRGILAQKPIGGNYREAVEVVKLCNKAGITLAVNQNMRYDQSIRACKTVIERGYLGEPVLATIDMRAIPHWMPWQQRQGWVTLRIMSIHHLDTFRYLFGDPVSVYSSVRQDPRTLKKFDHEDGIAMYILEYANGFRAMSCDDVWAVPDGVEARKNSGDIGINWRVEGTQGLARGTIGWPDYPSLTPSTIDFATAQSPGMWYQPRWKEVWFPDAFAGTMAQLLCALEEGREPEISGADNLKTMALVEACYQSAKTKRAVTLASIK
ncbi:MAG: Gfo/Idh/MocA family oxidoreductase [Phycisphaeraceae bacterium]